MSKKITGIWQKILSPLKSQKPLILFLTTHAFVFPNQILTYFFHRVFVYRKKKLGAVAATRFKGPWEFVFY